MKFRKNLEWKKEEKKRIKKWKSESCVNVHLLHEKIDLLSNCCHQRRFAHACCPASSSSVFTSPLVRLANPISKKQLHLHKTIPRSFSFVFEKRWVWFSQPKWPRLMFRTKTQRWPKSSFSHPLYHGSLSLSLSLNSNITPNTNLFLFLDESSRCRRRCTQFILIHR